MSNKSNKNITEIYFSFFLIKWFLQKLNLYLKCLLIEVLNVMVLFLSFRNTTFIILFMVLNIVML